MKAKIRYIYEAIAGAILSFLGFSGCTIYGPDMYGPPVEYGEPHADYKLVGTVRAEDTSEPLKGIQVKYRRYVYTDNDGIEHFTDRTFLTDAEGKIEASFGEFPMSDGMDKPEIVLEDIDGEEGGGKFQSDTLRTGYYNVSLDDSKQDSWYMGTYTLSFDAKLKKEE